MINIITCKENNFRNLQYSHIYFIGSLVSRYYLIIIIGKYIILYENLNLKKGKILSKI